jgi:hypothetical protein
MPNALETGPSAKARAGDVIKLMKVLLRETSPEVMLWKAARLARGCHEFGCQLRPQDSGEAKLCNDRDNHSRRSQVGFPSAWR